MGMFDYLRCEVPLPDGYEPVPNPEEGEPVGRLGRFQTKAFGCEMNEYVITKDGRLETECVHWVREAGKLKRIVRHIYDVHFCGIVYFYDGIDGDWHEYDAEFVDSKLVEIVVVTRERNGR